VITVEPSPLYNVITYSSRNTTDVLAKIIIIWDNRLQSWLQSGQRFTVA